MTIKGLAREADISRTTAQRYARGLPISRKSRAAIEAAIARTEVLWHLPQLTQLD